MASGAYFLWGILPIYWKLLQSVNPIEILAHRIIWCLLFLLVILLLSRNISTAMNEISRIAKHPAKIAGVVFASLFLTINWYSYIWAVNNDLVIQASLGYYINPLISVLLGVIVLKEKLSYWQKIACLFALCGVSILTVNYGAVPWTALIIALSFALYGLSKKMINIEPITGLILESSIMSFFSLYYLYHLHSNDSGIFGNSDPFITLLLIGAGIVTSIPLLLFSRAVNGLSLSLLGFLQYINPTFSLLLGIFIFHETFSMIHLVSFAIIWTGLLLYSASNGIERSSL
ncbi:MAG: EamA family transporter RarD [Syntrophomonadaceae bacterium]|nr:EamA family transporter RarD [Syntrophomonadaceae bacterium]